MTAPGDGLEEELRQALGAAASQVEPGDSGLERILARTGRTPPRSLLASTLAEAFRRFRYWTWRGHWAWQDPAYWRSGEWRSAAPVVRAIAARQRAAAWWVSARRPVAAWWRRGRRRAAAWWGHVSRSEMSAWLVPGVMPRSLRSGTGPHGLTWIRLGAGLAAVASVTVVTVAVPPLRAAFVEAGSSVLTGGAQALAPSLGAGPGTAGGQGRGGGVVSGASASTSPRVRRTAGPSGSAARPGVTLGPAPCLSWLPVAPPTSAAASPGGKGTATPTASVTPAPQELTTGGSSPGSGGRGSGGCPTTQPGTGTGPTPSAPVSPAPTSRAGATPTPTPSTTPASTPTPTPSVTPTSTSSTGSSGTPASSGTLGTGGTNPGNSDEQPAPTADGTPSGTAASSVPAG